MNQPSFVWFEFDNKVLALWQSLSQDKPTNTFAYQAKLRQLIGDVPQGSWGETLDSLKVLDVFLSAVKSDLAGRNIKEHELVAHPEFMKLLMVLSCHVHQVLMACIAQKMSNVAVECYTAAVFGRVYARAMSGQAGGLSESDLPAFYQGLAFLAKADNAFGVSVAQRFFVLSVIGARLFGSMERTFYDLDAQGAPTCVVEDSLYWAVHDFMEQLPTLYDDSAKQLFVAPTFSPLVKTDLTDFDEMAVTNTNQVNDGAFDGVSGANVATNQPAVTPAPSSQTAQPLSSSQTAPNVPSDLPSNPPKSPTTAPMSARKQKARASHTPKLFCEVYQDLKQLTTPHDSEERYQKAKVVLDKIDGHIDEKIAQGKALSDISFNQNVTQARNQALQLLSASAKAGNPSAMLRLAVYLFEGRGVPVNVSMATNLVKKSAEMGDFRAAKLLSRLYYQGFDADHGGIAMNVQMGEYWLDKSADGGHPEAKKVRAYMKQVQMLKDNRQTEIASDGRYLMWGAVLIVGILFIVAMIEAFF